LLSVSLLAALFLILLEFIPELGIRIFGIADVIRYGAADRFTLWGLAFDMWAQSPIWGQGFGAFVMQHGMAAHNTFLEILADTGLLGFLLFFGAVAYTLRSLFQVKRYAPSDRKRTDAFTFVLAAGLIGTCIMISTITLSDIKLFWLECSVCCLFFLFQRRAHFRALRKREEAS
jgi:O-antigen ligase